MPYRDIDTPPAVGWLNISWPMKPPRPCNVTSCGAMVNRGRVRVDNKDPETDGFVVICMDCWSKIELGVDPGGDPLPAWEEERRATSDPHT
jgi:hypothetical protein